MYLEVSDKGVCTVTSRVLSPSAAGPTPAAAASDAALAFSFPCVASSAGIPGQLEGPALNLWANISSAAAAAAAAGAPAAAGGCAITTLNPVLSFHRDPSLFHYGYTVKGLSCGAARPVKSAAAGNGRVVATASPGSGPIGIVYGISLVPSLPTPAQVLGAGRDVKSLSTAEQRCRLVVTAMGRVYMYQSKDTYPCTLAVNPEKSLGAGRCFGNGTA